MEYLKVSDRLKTTVDRLIAGGHKAKYIYLVSIKFITDKEMEFYIPSFELARFESYLSESKIFRLAYIDSGDVMINPNTIIAVLLEQKEFTNG